MIKVMVAEDNIDLNSTYCKFLTKDSDIEIVSATFDGESTLKEYFEKKPDVLLLDLDLPKMNGLDVLNNLSLNDEEKKKCNVIIISGNNNMRLSIYNTSKIYRIIPKPISLENILLTIKEITSPTKSLSQKKIKSLLKGLKFNLYSNGTDYIIEAINMAYYEPKLLYNISVLYSQIAAKYNLKPTKIQRSIRSSIDVMNNHISSELLQSFFHIYNNELIAPKYFFTIVIDYLHEK